MRSITNNDDCQRSQINLFGPAKDFSKNEIRSEAVTTLNMGAGETLEQVVTKSHEILFLDRKEDK